MRKQIEKIILGRLLFYPGDYLKVFDRLRPELFSGLERSTFETFCKEFFTSAGSGPDPLQITREVEAKTGQSAKALISEARDLAREAWNIRDKVKALEGFYIQDELKKVGEELTFSNREPIGLLSSALEKLLGLQSAKVGETTKPAQIVSKEAREATAARVKAYREGGRIPGMVSTGFEALDSAIGGGMMPGELYYLAGRPGMGKTTVFVNAANKMAAEGVPVLIITLDMTNDHIANKMICERAMIVEGKVRAGTLTNEELEAYNKASKEIDFLPISFNQTSRLRGDFLAVVTAWIIANSGKGYTPVVFVDFMQQVKDPKLSKQRYLEVSQTSNDLRAIATDRGVIVVALAQLSRAVEARGGDKRPQNSDLRDSGELEQDATGIFLVYRPEYYGFETDEEGNSTAGLMEVIIGKNRNGTPNSVVKLHFMPQFCKVTDMPTFQSPSKIGIYNPFENGKDSFF